MSEYKQKKVNDLDKNQNLEKNPQEEVKKEKDMNFF